jgi:hypothetical protein
MIRPRHRAERTPRWCQAVVHVVAPTDRFQCVLWFKKTRAVALSPSSTPIEGATQQFARLGDVKLKRSTQPLDEVASSEALSDGEQYFRRDRDEASRLFHRLSNAAHQIRRGKSSPSHTKKV